MGASAARDTRAVTHGPWRRGIVSPRAQGHGARPQHRAAAAKSGTRQANQPLGASVWALGARRVQRSGPLTSAAGPVRRTRGQCSDWRGARAKPPLVE